MIAPQANTEELPTSSPAPGKSGDYGAGSSTETLKGVQKRAAALEAAEEHFRSALTLDARSAAAWFGLGRCLQQAARPDEALVALRKARRFGWSPSLDLALGKLELERGRTQQAFDLLWPLVQDPHEGHAHDEASKLLEQAGLLPEAASGKKP